LHLTVSAGVAEFTPGDADFGGLLVRADQALYEAKGAGRNRVMTAKPPGRLRAISAA
jgi:PleD family two-component response regulator